MRFAFLTNTPAHVHLYRNAVVRLEANGHDVLVLARDYECTRALLDFFELPFEVYGACGPSKVALFSALPSHFAGIARLARRFGPDLVFGMGAYAACAGLVARAPTVLVLDSEPTAIDHAVSRPVARTILTPAAFGKDLGPKHYQFRGFKECAYLHPDEFEPDPAVRSALGVSPEERFAVVRFNAFGSHHDFGRHGFSPGQRRTLVERLAEHATVFVSGPTDGVPTDHPGVQRYQLHPARIHDTLAEASLLVADSQTMVTESALLGTPAVRSNTFVGEADMGNFVELERRNLVRNVRAFDDVLAVATELLTDETVGERWRARRATYVAELVNLTRVITEIATRGGTVAETPGVAPYGMPFGT